MADNELQNLLKSGIQAARSGNKVIAKNIFEQVLQLDSQNELAWMWLASVVDSPAERQRALQRVLSINPNNEKAKDALAKMGAVPTKPPSPPPVIPEPEPEPAISFFAPEPESAVQMNAIPEAEPRPARQGGSALSWMIGGLAFLLVLAAVGIAGLQFTGFFDDATTPTPTRVAQRPTQAATEIPASPTPNFVTVVPGSANDLSNELPPTWTPNPTSTTLPTTTPTPLPSDPSAFELVFSVQENPAARPLLQIIKGDGTEAETLDITLVEAEAEPPAQATEEVSEDATAEPEAEPSTQAFSEIELIDPAWSPDGTFIAFTAQIGESVQELFLYNVGTGRVRQLTELGGSAADGAAWSPNGERIAFSSNLSSEDGEGGSGAFDIYLINVDSGEIINRTGGLGQNREPSWSPDGETIVFSSDRNTPNELEVWALPSTATIPVQLTDAINSSFSPVFSPDGNQIAFISNRGGDNDVYIMNADGTDERLVSINDGTADDRDPAWSPDGSWLVVSSTRDENRALQLWIVSPDGREWRQLTQGLGASRYADWRPVNEIE